MSHETIYLWIWRDKAAGGSLCTFLRGANKRRRKRYGRKDSRGRLAGKRPIQDRPAVVNRRGRCGDWEADTIRGRGQPAAASLAERKSGMLRLGPLPRATVELTNARVIKLLAHEPHPVHTITSDNGVEFHGYKDIERQLGTTFYFATPHHAWERGTNENTNGLIRDFYPKGTNFNHVTDTDLTHTARLLNIRPRQTLKWATPAETLEPLLNVALTT